MTPLLKTRLLIPLGAISWAMAAGAVELICTQNSPPVINPSIDPVTIAVGGNQVLIPAAGKTLATDPDGDTIRVFADPQTGTAGGTLIVKDPGNGTSPTLLQYTSPPTLAGGALTATETFQFNVHDGHGAWAMVAGPDPATEVLATGTITVNLTATPPPPPTPTCDRIAGGDCFGQTWDGRWFTLEEEKKGLVRALDGVTRVALFHPSKAEYIKPDQHKGDIIAIFPPPGAAESYWGCGPIEAPARTSKFACDFSRSLRGDVTYMLRLAVVKGRFYRTSVQLSASELYDQWGAWFTALSLSPNTTIGYSKTSSAPTGEPAGCVRLGGSAIYNPYSCKYLNTAVTKYSTTEDTMLYLKLQAAPNRAFSGTWTGTPSSACGTSLRCRMYVIGW